MGPLSLSLSLSLSLLAQHTVPAKNSMVHTASKSHTANIHNLFPVSVLLLLLPPLPVQDSPHTSIRHRPPISEGLVTHRVSSTP